MNEKPVAVFADVTEPWQTDLLTDRLGDTFELSIEERPISEIAGEHHSSASIVSVFINSECDAEELKQYGSRRTNRHGCPTRSSGGEPCRGGRTRCP